MTDKLREAAERTLRWLDSETPTTVDAAYAEERAIADDLRAALTTSVPHGCHVDLEHGVEPDGCVLDEGRPKKCIYAKRLHREGKDKTACEYWKPIEVKK